MSKHQEFRPRLRRTVAVSAVVALGLVAGACASDTGKKSTGSSTGGGGGATVTMQGDVGTPNLNEIFNPFLPATMLRGNYLIYAPLEAVSSVNGSFVPFLATGNHYTNPTTLVFTLRSGVDWSDGKPFSAADVLFTFQMLKKYPALDTSGVWSEIDGVSASGNQVTFHFKSPNVPFAASIAQTPIVPEHLWQSVKDPATYNDTDPVGSGPYELEHFSPTGYTLTKNPHYWAASSLAASTVNYPASPSNQTSSQLDVTSGQYDWAYNYIPSVQSTYVAKAASTRSYWFPPGGAIALFLNLTKAPYNDVAFRQGISEALNRQEISDKAVDGYMHPASSSGLILPNLQQWLDPSLPDQGVVSQNLTKAMSDFAQAGYHLRGGKLVGANGKAVSMTITVPNSYSDWVAGSEEVRTQLAQVGISVSLNTPQAAQYQSTIDSGTFDAAFGGYGGTGTPYNDMNNAFNSSFATPVNTATTNNFERYKNPQVDALLARLAAATSTAAQKSATDQLEQLIYAQMPIVFMYYGGSWGLFQTDHFSGWPSASDPYTLPTPYNYSVLIVLTRIRKA